jgi:hypothetical protein
MALSVRTRFEVFKRDEFTCRYCGRRSPEVVLQVDHIVPVCDGGSDDQINLATSCWECNSGKSGVPLNELITGEDPHDRAIEILERKRQLEEYNRVLAEDREAREAEAWKVWRYWQTERGFTDDRLNNMPRRDFTWLMNCLTTVPSTKMLDFIDAAFAAGATRDFRYVGGCVKKWREAQQAQREQQEADADHAGYHALRHSIIDEVIREVVRADTRLSQAAQCLHEPPCVSGDPLFCVLREAMARLGFQIPEKDG